MTDKWEHISKSKIFEAVMDLQGRVAKLEEENKKLRIALNAEQNKVVHYSTDNPMTLITNIFGKWF